MKKSRPYVLSINNKTGVSSPISFSSYSISFYYISVCVELCLVGRGFPPKLALFADFSSIYHIQLDKLREVQRCCDGRGAVLCV
jgi:hypothetical protein